MHKDNRSVTTATALGKQTEDFFFQAYKKRFFTAVKWNTFESLAYQTFFVIHQIGLFTYCDKTLYGKMGVIFSSSYLAITFLIAGLDGGLLPFFKDFIAHKKSFSYLLFYYVKRQIFFIVAVVCIVFLFFSTRTSFHAFDRYTLFLISLFVIAEGTKKLIKHLLYLAFYNNYTAVLEVAQIALYTGTIWICYWQDMPFSISLFLLPFIGYSLLFSSVSCVLLYEYYKTLPTLEFVPTLPSTQNFRAVRFSVIINQMCRSLFTSNFLVPLFSVYGGFAQAGIMSFVNYLTHACTFFIYKICIPPAEAFFSRSASFSVSLQYQAFKIVLIFFGALTTGLALFVFLQGKTLASFAGYTTITHVTWTLFLFFFFIHLLENMFMLYEKFFLLQNRARFLAVGNIFTCSLCVFMSMFSYSFFFLVLICIGIRFLFFFMLSLLISLSKQAPDGTLQSTFRRWPLLNVFYFDNTNR